MGKINNLPILFLLLSLFSTMLNGCSTTGLTSRSNDLPIFSQNDLTRPYTTIGRIQVTREIYGADYVLSPDITAWGLAAIREEAEKMSADGVILPEVTGRTSTYGIIPSTEYRATGFAIKFK